MVITYGESSELHLNDVCADCRVLYEFCRLVDNLVQDIIHLEAELVSTRYELSHYLKGPYGDFLRSDIFSSLARRYSGEGSYDIYVEWYCDNQDPMEAEEKARWMWNISQGLEKYNI